MGGLARQDVRGKCENVSMWRPGMKCVDCAPCCYFSFLLFGKYLTNYFTYCEQNQSQILKKFLYFFSQHFLFYDAIRN